MEGRQYSHSTLGIKKWTNKAKWQMDDRTGEHSHITDAGDCFGADFGGTLTKIVFFEPDEIPKHAEEIASLLKSSDVYGSTGVRDKHLWFHSDKLGGTFHFIRYESSRTEGAMDLLKGYSHCLKTIHSTGGGAHKYAELFKEKLGITLIKEDELETVVRGIVFTLLEHPIGECYSYDPKETTAKQTQNEMPVNMAKIHRPMPVADGSLFPLIVVNIGSGVSLIKVDSPNSFHRISGTAIGGGTYYGLAKLLTRCTSYDGAMDLASEGDSRRVNLLVQDIYGGAYEKIGLPGELTASFFGKAAATHGASRPASSSSSSSSRRPSSWIKRHLRRFFVCMKDDQKRFQALTVLFGVVSVLINFALNMHNDMDQETWWRIFFLTVTSATPFLLLLYFLRSVGQSMDPTGRAAAAAARALDNHLQEEHEEIFLDADICRALVVMVAQNVTQIAFLNARIHKSTRVIFTGNFLRHNQIAMRILTNSMRVWSKGEIRALFMEHEGYFGAIGSFLYSLGLDAKGDDERCRRDSLAADED